MATSVGVGGRGVVGQRGDVRNEVAGVTLPRDPEQVLMVRHLDGSPLVGGCLDGFDELRVLDREVPDVGHHLSVFAGSARDQTAQEHLALPGLDQQPLVGELLNHPRPGAVGDRASTAQAEDQGAEDHPHDQQFDDGEPLAIAAVCHFLPPCLAYRCSVRDGHV